MSEKTPEQIVAYVREAGVIGAGGRGFPTHARLEAKADTVIINACECEPLIHTDKYLLQTFTDDVIQGLKLAMHATGAIDGVIAVNCEDLESIRALNKIQDPKIRVHLMGNYYPSGDEMLTVYDVTKRVVPEGGTPLDVGVLVLNVLTARQIYQAIQGIVATERTLTIAGAVKTPKVVSVPVGTRFSELLALAGGPSRGFSMQTLTVLEGGPMMGKVVSNLESGISKSTQAITVLPTAHYVIQMKLKSNAEIVAQSKAVSGQGTLSTDLCPRHLLGHQIDPDAAMVALDYSKSDPVSAITSAFLCSECGVCEMVGDEASFTSPKRVYLEYRKRLEKAGVKNPHHRSGFPVHSQYENRKLSLPTLIMKLGIGEFVQKPERAGPKPASMVRIATNRHLGPASNPVVNLNQRVRRGDLIAESAEHELGTYYHASIHGTVSAITDHWIQITGEPA